MVVLVHRLRRRVDDSTQAHSSNVSGPLPSVSASDNAPKDTQSDFQCSDVARDRIRAGLEAALEGWNTDSGVCQLRRRLLAVLTALEEVDDGSE